MPKHISQSSRKIGSRVVKNIRKPKESILIVCEGKETEPNYFQTLCKYLKLYPVNVEVVGEGGAPISVVEKALKLKANRAKEAKNSLTLATFDEVWCVFDTENLIDNPSYQKAVKLAEDRNLKLAICNPCIELWFLLHFNYTTQSFNNCIEAKREIKNCIPNYQVNTPVFEKLREKTQFAIDNAEKLLKNHPALSAEIIDEEFLHNRIKDLNPSTTVHLLVKKLVEMSSTPL